MLEAWLNVLEESLRGKGIAMVDLPTFDIDPVELYHAGMTTFRVVDMVLFLLTYENESLRVTGVECAD